MKILAGIILLTLVSYTVHSQVGGKNTFEFLDLPNAARVASLGGNSISIYDHDLNLAFHNPSILSKEMDNQMVINYINYFTDVNFGYVSYAKNFNDYGNFAAGLHYINYGKFIAADETGIITGEFKAAEYALNLMHSYDLNEKFAIGGNLKVIYSALESYTSFALALDAGITYHTENGWNAALVLKNVGRQLKPYYKGNIEPLPFDIQVGLSKRLQHAPFRFSITAQNLTNFSTRYDKPEESSENIIAIDTVEVNKIERWADETARHFIVAAEFIPTKNFYIRFGYNYQRRQELKISTRSRLVGFSTGVGFRISKFHFSYGLANYHLAGSSHHFSVATNIADFYKNEKDKIE